MSKMSDFQILLFEETYKVYQEYMATREKVIDTSDLRSAQKQEAYIKMMKAKGAYDALEGIINQFGIEEEYLEYVVDLIDDEATESYTVKSVTANDNNDSRFNTFNSDSLN